MKTLVLGAGQVGFGIASYLHSRGDDVTIIEKSPEVAAEIKSISNIDIVVGNAMNTEVLKEACAEIASHVIATMSSDEQNIVACKFAGALFSVKTKIARIRSTAFLQGNIFEFFLRENFDIDTIIQPEIEIADAICNIAQINGAFDVFYTENAVIVGLKCVKNTEVLNTPFKHFAGITDLDIFVLTITRNNSTFFPQKTDILIPDDEIYIATTAQHLNSALKLFGYDQSKNQNILIAGGAALSTIIIEAMLKKSPKFNITIIEDSIEKAEKIAERFPNITTIFGNHMDYQFLKEVAQDIDTAIVASDKEKTNVLTSLFLKQTETKRILTLVKSHDYESLLPLSAECSLINPNAITIDVIVQKTRKGKITYVKQLRNKIADVVEAYVTESCTCVGNCVQSLKTKAQIIPIFIVRGGITMLAQSDLILCSGDVVVMLVAKDSMKSVEKIFSNYVFSEKSTSNNFSVTQDDEII
jgi:trk system potassium uptake protein TrkA